MAWNIEMDEPQFRPLTIRIETQDDYDKLFAIVSAVADDKLVRAPQVIDAARQFRHALTCVIALG
jgi:hypothetical protein